MRKMLTIAAREYKAVVRTKSFLVSLVLMPLLMGGSFIFQKLLEGQGSTKAKHFAVVDRTPGAKFFPKLAEAAQRRNEAIGERKESPFLLEQAPAEPDMDRQRHEMAERVRNKELEGFLEIGASVLRSTPSNADASDTALDPFRLRYQSNSPLAQAFPQWAARVLGEAVETERIVDDGLDPAKVKAATQPVPFAAKDLHGRNISLIASFFAPFGLIILMFMVIMIGATPLVQGVVEEKSLRIAEVLLGSVSPFALMMGKLIGTVGISLTLAGVYLGGAFWAAHQFHYAEYLPLDVLVWFVVFQVLAVLMYGSLFIAIGAAASDIKETQTLMMPVMVLACIPIFSVMNVIQDPDSPFATALSFFPPATPMLMVARQAVPPGITWWQPVLGVLSVLATTLLFVWAAGRIFRVGILMQGKGARLGEMLKWVFRG